MLNRWYLRHVGRIFNNYYIEVEGKEINHEIYDYLDKAFSTYFADYEGLNCEILETRIREN